MDKRQRTILINIATVIAILAVVEIACRITLKKIYNRDFDSSLIVDNKYFNSAGLRENAHGVIWGKDFNTDSFGCRKPAKPYNKNKKKWLFIGDSVTEGVGVDDSSAYAYKVSDKVDSVNIMNYSLIGYSDADYLNVLKTVLSKNDSTISRATIFFCLNDVYGKTSTNKLPVMAKQNWIGKLNALLQRHYATYKLLKLLVCQNSSRYFQYDLAFYNKDGKQFIESMNILQQCDSVCKAKGVKMDVVMLPYRSQLSGKYKGDELPQQLVQGFCKKNEIMFSDPYKELSHVSNADGLYLFADEIHFSEQGHGAIANFILSH